jgi:hypothetical protein
MHATSQANASACCHSSAMPQNCECLRTHVKISQPVLGLASLLSPPVVSIECLCLIYRLASGREASGIGDWFISRDWPGNCSGAGTLRCTCELAGSLMEDIIDRRKHAIVSKAGVARQVVK